MLEKRKVFSLALKDESSVYSLVGVNSKNWVQSKRRCESHGSCIICIVGFSACGCQKKSIVIVYKTERRHVAVQRDKQDQNHLQL